MKRIVWRTDSRVFEPGATMQSAGDHYFTIDKAHKKTESALREAMGKRGALRASSLYTWEDEIWARRAWSYEKQKCLYKLEIDDVDILYRGDVNHYTDIGAAIEQDVDASESIQNYLNGNDSARVKYPTARFEILVRKALVIEKFYQRHAPAS